MWGYSEIGLELARRGLPAEERYARWIEVYAAADFADLAGWCRELVDRVTGGLDGRRLAAGRGGVRHLQPVRAGVLGDGLAGGGVAGGGG